MRGFLVDDAVCGLFNDVLYGVIPVFWVVFDVSCFSAIVFGLFCC